MKPDTDKSRIPDYLFHVAQGFYDVGLQLAHYIKKEESIKGFQRIAPAAMNFTFAVELLLKGLHSLTTRMNLKTHKLWDLYEQLPSDIKQRIEDKYNIYKSLKFDDLTAIRTVVTPNNEKGNEEKTNNTNIISDLRDLLLIHNNAFEDWRYLYEVQPNGYMYEYNFKLMNAFIKSLGEVINETKSGLKPSFIIGRAK